MIYSWYVAIVNSGNIYLNSSASSAAYTSEKRVSIGPLGINYSDILIESVHFHLRKSICKYRLQNGGHFVQGGWVNIYPIHSDHIVTPNAGNTRHVAYHQPQPCVALVRSKPRGKYFLLRVENFLTTYFIDKGYFRASMWYWKVHYWNCHDMFSNTQHDLFQFNNNSQLYSSFNQ